jgi:HK97 family phage major capsid protein
MDLNQLREAYNAAVERVQSAARAVEAPEDGADTEALQRALDESIETAERAKARLDEAESRAAAVARFQPVEVPPPAPGERSRVEVGDEERVYRPDVQRSFFGDLMRAQVFNDAEATERIGRHQEQMRDITTAAGADGVVPPQYLTELFVDLPREGRQIADILGASRPLPETGMVITIPRLASGAAVASQNGENSAIQETDADTDTVTAPVRTIAGMQDMSQQSVDRTDPAFDRIIMEDLQAAYDTELDRQVVNGTGTNGQHTGLLSAAGTIAVTYTDASPTGEELLPKAHDALQQMWTNIFRSATHVIMHPRRAAWLAAQMTPNAPLFPQPSIVAGQRGQQQAGFIQSFAGLPVIVSANVPTNLGAGINEDRIIFVRAANEIPLFEGPMNMVVQRLQNSPLSGTLTVRIIAYAYSAFFANRRPKAIAVISGTGLVAPTF